MKISVAMATYNGEKYIVEQLDSIRIQTMPVDEVIIHDDCSTDNTVSVMEQYIEKYNLQDKWKVIQNKKNLGYASNFMAAVKDTAGEFIFFCDQDDIWCPNRVEKMVETMEKNSKIMMLGSEFEPFVCDENAPKISAKVLKSFVGDDSLEHFYMKPSNVFIGSEGCTMCIRRELINKTIEFWVDGWAHDEYVWKMALCMDGCYVLHTKTLYRRMHANNVSKRKMRDLSKRIRFLKDLVISHEQTLKFAEYIGLPFEIVHLLHRNIIATKLRIELLEQKKVWNTFVLTFKYRDCYHSKKSIPVELVMVLKQKTHKG